MSQKEKIKYTNYQEKIHKTKNVKHNLIKM